ncbi:MAG TPA: response regulator [Vicinamibacterales bacterium]|nr:response regulator [Vicinamibacterales bacterium]
MPKLLLADDSVTIQRVIELTFADEDIQVIAVGDGQQAIARIDAERPDVVLADIGMPERDGYEVATHVKRNPDTAHIPVLLLTGAFEPIDEARARASGCDGVLVKPFEPQMVINRVKDLLAGRRPASLWSTPGTPPGAATAPARAGSPAGAAAADASAAPRPGEGEKALESLDDYFDRLDAAFSAEGAPVAPPLEMPLPGPAPQQPQDRSADFGSWDIPPEGGGVRPGGRGAEPPRGPVTPPAAEQVQPPAPAPASAPHETPAMAPAPPPAAQLPALADAFAALLAAEQNIGVPGAGAAPAPGLDESTIDEIVNRVIARMSGDAVRSTVLEVAERMVREEIERIKRRQD